MKCSECGYEMILSDKEDGMYYCPNDDCDLFGLLYDKCPYCGQVINH